MLPHATRGLLPYPIPDHVFAMEAGTRDAEARFAPATPACWHPPLWPELTLTRVLGVLWRVGGAHTAPGVLLGSKLCPKLEASWALLRVPRKPYLRARPR